MHVRRAGRAGIAIASERVVDPIAGGLIGILVVLALYAVPGSIRHPVTTD
ncbi:MAG TPA: hypothetical protein VHL31_00050 [Geminicoccus sp.]|jgi:hypothetical protein|nr:hypothetical protein [Geminicoccus sp.]HEX2524684.1 hypothetical protein [Geminicoccus sp.]